MNLSKGTLHRLENLAFVPRGVRRGALKGDRRSPRSGSSIEFADYRAYVPGDDLRRLDWNVYARTDRPFLKLFEDEEDLGIHILLDASGSMAWGEGPENKFDHANSLAAGIAMIALAGGDRCGISILAEGRPIQKFGPHRNLRSFAGFIPFIESQRASGKTDLNRSLRQFTQQAVPPGIVIVISDLFSPTGYREGLKQLGQHGHEILLIQPLSPDEINPPLSGELKLVDKETDKVQEVTITANLRRVYQSRVMAWRNEINKFCNSHRIHFFPTVTSDPPERLLLFDFRRRGLVR